MLLTLTDVFDVYPAYLSPGSVFFFFFLVGLSDVPSPAQTCALYFIVGQAKEF